MKCAPGLEVWPNMESFNFFFGIELGSMVLNMADNLSKALQGSSVSGTEGQNLMKMTVTSLQSIRQKSLFTCFGRKLKRNGRNWSVKFYHQQFQENVEHQHDLKWVHQFL